MSYNAYEQAPSGLPCGSTVSALADSVGYAVKLSGGVLALSGSQGEKTLGPLTIQVTKTGQHAAPHAIPGEKVLLKVGANGATANSEATSAGDGRWENGSSGDWIHAIFLETGGENSRVWAYIVDGYTKS